MSTTLSRHTDPYPHWCWRHPGSGDLLRLVPERGGLVSGWRCDGREILYLDEARFADPSRSVRGGIPVLFPICGNLPDDVLPLPRGRFHLPQHGFARDRPWRLEELPGGEGVRLTLEHAPETLAAYPFRFRLAMAVRPQPRALAISLTVTHLGRESGDGSESGSDLMPFSLGLHPYFRVADPAQVRFEGLPGRCLDHHTMAEAETAGVLAALPQGVDLLTRPAGPVTLVDEAAGCRLQLQLSPPLDRAVVWSEPPRPMVCLEPWSGPRGSLLSGDGRLELAGGASCELHCRYALTAAA